MSLISTDPHVAGGYLVLLVAESTAVKVKCAGGGGGMLVIILNFVQRVSSGFCYVLLSIQTLCCVRAPGQHVLLLY